MAESTVLYVSRPLTAGVVRELTGKVRGLLDNGKELEANILLLRYASKRPTKYLRKEAEEWQQSSK